MHKIVNKLDEKGLLIKKKQMLFMAEEEEVDEY